MMPDYKPATPEEMTEWEKQAIDTEHLTAWNIETMRIERILSLIATVRERDTRIKELEADLPPPGYLRRPGFLPNITVARRSKLMPIDLDKLEEFFEANLHGIQLDGLTSTEQEHRLSEAYPRLIAQLRAQDKALWLAEEFIVRDAGLKEQALAAIRRALHAE